MTTRDIIHETFSALTANKVRTSLTMLGIIIGIGSVISMVSIGQGAQASIQSSIEGLGANLLTIYPGALQPGRGIVSSGRGAAQSLVNEDIEVLQEIPGVSLIAPQLDRRFQIVSSLGNNTNSTVIGTSPAYAQIRNMTTVNGIFFTENQNNSLAKVAVIGPTVATDLFGAEDPLGQTLKVNGVIFRVIGVLEAKGGSGFANQDDMVFVPISTMQKILAGVDYLSVIAVSVEDKDQMENVRTLATEALIKKHRVDEADFSIISQADILGTLNQVTDAFTLFLAAIASISLVVGGIGIMNMMLTTVTERTREIGLRKAIGATRHDINLQFLTEAVALTLIGGAIGVILGWAVATTVSSLGLIQTEVSLMSVILAFGVSAVIGIAFGYYPARRASRLNPIEALRYE
ncbi:MAG: ABC transporter permease, partial [Patescibacteria group bacterium]